MPNWGNLVSKGRVKAIGIQWSSEESEALKLGIPADFVRDGVLTLEDYEKAKAKDAKEGVPLHRQSKDELAKQAKEAGVEFTPDAPKEALASEVAKTKKGGKNKIV
jgi:hypothetical protein